MMKFSDMLPGGKDWSWTVEDWAGWFAIVMSLVAIGYGIMGLLA